ncbi:MAG TPA: hypothetical protein VLI90_13175 [Tepidisphaeraceae bacterium]|nr:hypothetical protein [Tepidisphaeraceae bacterium]
MLLPQVGKLALQIIGAAARFGLVVPRQLTQPLPDPVLHRLRLLDAVEDGQHLRV